jgi:Protein of unknown function (DUF1488)
VEALELEPRISTDGRGVVFVLSVLGRDIECMVTREALEQHFWVQPDASEARILKAFADGRKRIIAVAERKTRAHAGERIVLTVDDFGVRR